MTPALQTILLGGRAFYPTDLGSSLLALWDAERAASMTLAGSLVTTWTDVVGPYALTQSSTSPKPAYSPTSFNGRPGVAFDGNDDELTLASVPAPFPIGSAACELWALTDQQNVAANSSAGAVIGYGGEATLGLVRDMRRGVTGGVNRARTGVGNGSGTGQIANLNVDFSGRHIVRSVINPTDTTTYIDNNSSGATAIVPGTGSTRVRMGAFTNAPATNFYLGVINMVVITSLLSGAQATALYNFLLARKG